MITFDIWLKPISDISLSKVRIIKNELNLIRLDEIDLKTKLKDPKGFCLKECISENEKDEYAKILREIGVDFHVVEAYWVLPIESFVDLMTVTLAIKVKNPNINSLKKIKDFFNLEYNNLLELRNAIGNGNYHIVTKDVCFSKDELEKTIKELEDLGIDVKVVARQL